ncbi:uncharacterized protein L201_005226 [Kwoniella dendrophila CBS 6074]|uniref:Thiol methyltransferase 1 n=1 Tax=Kwoniella dendrophila CBS 6074 TaxID=1295534 RepID=A0AAX4JZJ5_9TREE
MASGEIDTAWEERWQEGRTGWDQSQSHASLVSLLKSDKAGELGIPKKGKALIPGCGTGYDVYTFASSGLHATGMDLAPTGVEKARKWLECQPKTDGIAEVICGDFFNYDVENKFDVIYDYTFLCAIPPALHSSWSSQMNKLSTSNAKLITLMYPLPPTDNKPPPFQVTVELYHELLDEHWELIWIQDVPEDERRKTGAGGSEKIAVWRTK